MIRNNPSYYAKCFVSVPVIFTCFPTQIGGKICLDFKKKKIFEVSKCKNCSKVISLSDRHSEKYIFIFTSVWGESRLPILLKGKSF